MAVDAAVQVLKTFKHQSLNLSLFKSLKKYTKFKEFR